MKTVIFGGTGDVGQTIVDKLIQQNNFVTVLTRQAKTSTEKINFKTGDVLDYTAVLNCIEEGDRIIISLGFNNSALNTMSEGTKNILAAMKAKKCDRVICLSAQGVGDSWNYMPDEFKNMVLNDPVLKPSFHDHGIQEEFIKASAFAWTIVRPTEIINAPETKTFTKNRPAKDAKFHISKYDVAQFIVDELEEKKYVREVVMITN